MLPLTGSPNLNDNVLGIVFAGVLTGIAMDRSGRIIGKVVALLTDNDSKILELFFRIVVTDISARIITDNYRDESSYLLLKSAVVVVLTLAAVSGLQEIKRPFMIPERELRRMNLIAFLSGTSMAITIGHTASIFHPTAGLVLGILAADEIARRSSTLHIRVETANGLI